jgi:hypothetical protein
LPSIALLLTRTSTPSTGTGQQLPILDLDRAFAENVHEYVAGARDRHDVAFAEDGVTGGLLDRPVAADPQDEQARRHGLGVDDLHAGSRPAAPEPPAPRPR